MVSVKPRLLLLCLPNIRQKHQTLGRGLHNVFVFRRPRKTKNIVYEYKNVYGHAPMFRCFCLMFGKHRSRRRGIMHYKYSTTDITQQLYDQEKISLIWTKLQMKWDELHERNVLRYKIGDIEEKVVGGRYLLQLNPDRGFNRRCPEDIKSIIQPFDPSLFNFTKILNEEIIMNISKEHDSDVHAIIANVSPISRYHSLICPFIMKCLPQIVTLESLILILEIMFLFQDRDVRIGFNSLCALASVNHLHYHILVESYRLPIEYAKSVYIAGQVYCLEDIPVQAFCFQIKKSADIKKVSDNVLKLINYFLNENIAHNIMFTRGDELSGDGSEVLRIVVWPRKKFIGEKHYRSFNVAICELSGWFPIYDKKTFDDISEASLNSELHKWTVDDFQNLCYKIKLLFTEI